MTEVTVHHGDAIEVLSTLDDASVDAVVTDPPYDLTAVSRGGSPRPPGTGPYGRHTVDTVGGGFMGRLWDGTGVAFRVELWAECLRVLKPGGHLLSFGGTRTYHRLVCAIEDAGFEIRDSIVWIYGSGFPKSLDVSKAIDKAAGAQREVVGDKLARPGYHLMPGDRAGAALGDGVNGHTAEQRLAAAQITAPATDDAARWSGWGTALKPAHENIVVARRPLVGTVAANVLSYGTGAINIDGCRVQYLSDADRAFTESHNRHGTWGSGPRLNNVLGDMSQNDRAEEGDYDASAGRWPSNVVLDEEAAAALDAQSGALTSGANPTRRGSDKFRDTYAAFAGQRECTPARGAESGGASRFFHVFKYQAKAPTSERPKVNGVAHPTVKPLGLMRWLVRLVTPPGGLVLDPFAGSGTTGEACQLEGFSAILIEREADYLPLIEARLARSS